MQLRKASVAFASILIILSFVSRAHGDPGGTAVAVTPHFVFHSDFETNLNDALIVAGKARKRESPELFRSGDDASCFSELPPSARAGWNLAVDWYAEILASSDWSDRPQALIRYALAGLEGRDDDRARRFVTVARGFMMAAAPAYEVCHWARRDAENRGWIEDLAPRLEAHAAAIAPRLETLYATPWHGLPIRVDVVANAPSLGANTWILDPGGHILISTKVDRDDALETVFHEASHTLMAPWRPDPVPEALVEIAKELEVEIIRDLWHVVMFYTTGMVVKDVLERSGEPDYTPYMYKHGLWRGSWAPYREAVESSWPAYISGERTLHEAVTRLIEQSREAAVDR